MHSHRPTALRNLHAPGRSKRSRDWGPGAMGGRAGAPVRSILNPRPSEGLRWGLDTEETPVQMPCWGAVFFSGSSGCPHALKRIFSRTCTYNVSDSIPSTEDTTVSNKDQIPGLVEFVSSEEDRH